MAHRASLATRAALVAAGVALTVVAPPSGAAPMGAPPCNKPGRFVTQPHFLAMSLPGFPDSDYPLDNNAITAASRNVISSDYGLGRTFNAAVANTSTVFVTADGGCNWSTAYSLPAVADTDGNSGPLLANVDKVLAVAVSKQPGTHDVYVDVEGPNLHSSDARLLVSHSGGSSFTTHQFPGLESAHPVTSPVETGVTYVLGHPSDASQPQLWRTDDAGGHWTACAVPPGVRWGSPEISGLYIDPTVRRRVWAYTDDDTGTVFRSDDAGRTWRRTGQVGSHIQFFALWYRGRTAVLATAPSSNQAPAPDATPGSMNNLPYFLLDLSTNGGATWRELHLPVQTAQANATLVGLAQPPRQESVSAIMEFTPDTRTGTVHALTLTGNRWRVTGALQWVDHSNALSASKSVLPGSVGAWWGDFNPSGNWLFRYSKEP